MSRRRNTIDPKATLLVFENPTQKQFESIAKALRPRTRRAIGIDGDYIVASRFGMDGTDLYFTYGCPRCSADHRLLVKQYGDARRVMHTALLDDGTRYLKLKQMTTPPCTKRKAEPFFVLAELSEEPDSETLIVYDYDPSNDRSRSAQAA